MPTLIFTDSFNPVRVGDMGHAPNGGFAFEVLSITEPHKAGSTGRVYVACIGDGGDVVSKREVFPSVIGAGWIDRTDGGAEVAEFTGRMS